MIAQILLFFFIHLFTISALNLGGRVLMEKAVFPLHFPPPARPPVTLPLLTTSFSDLQEHERRQLRVDVT